MHMQRRQQAETAEGRLSPDLTPVEARLASTSASLDGCRGCLLPKAGSRLLQKEISKYRLESLALAASGWPWATGVPNMGRCGTGA